MKSTAVLTLVGAALGVSHVPFDMTWVGGTTTSSLACDQYTGGECPLNCATLTIEAHTDISLAGAESYDDLIIGVGADFSLGPGASVDITVNTESTCCDALVATGMYESDVPNRQCKLLCRPGQFTVGTAAARTCSACPAGKWSDTFNTAACTECAKGTYADPVHYSQVVSHNMGSVHGCDVCPSGKWQDTLSQTNCSLCAAGYQDITGSTGSKAHDDQCTSCPNGQFQHQAGSLSCYNCPSGKFSTHSFNGATYIKDTCLGCASSYHAIDTTEDGNLRQYWTQNQAGWDKCEKKALDCDMPAFNDDYSTCSKSCRNSADATYGDHQRFIAPTYHAWGELAHATVALRPTLCSATGIVGDANTQDYVAWRPATDNWEQSKRCNFDWCPVDCIVSAFGNWDQCTKSCGGGETTRTRTVVRASEYGGKACPVSSETESCNPHTCKDAVCHSKHVTCQVRWFRYGRKNHGSTGADYTDTNVHGKHYGLNNRPTRCTSANNDVAGEPTRCHECDTTAECAMKYPHDMPTIEVMHDHRFSNVGEGGFKCAVQDSTGTIKFGKHTIPEANKVCECKCKEHPTGCYKKNKILQNDYLMGNIHQGILDLHACSNLCSHHPDCESWEFKSTRECILNSGAPVFEDNLNTGITTWAGSKSGVNGCVVEGGNTRCPHGKYQDEEHGTDMCVTCPVGYMNAYTNAKSCELKIANLTASGCPYAQYIFTSAVADQSYCVPCPPGTYSDDPKDEKCRKALQHHTKPDTTAPTSYPTNYPTLYPSSPDCTSVCENTITHPDHAIHATCLACKADMAVADFCTTYPTVDGC
jgi:hypothetical protein